MSTTISIRQLRFVALLALLTLFWACYPQSEVTYSKPQASTSQWMIEMTPGEPTVQLTMR